MKIAFSCVTAFCVSIVVFLFASTAAGQSIKVKNDLGKSFRKYDIVRPIDSLTPTEGPSKTVKVRAAGKTFDLEVTPNSMLSRRYRAEDTGFIGITPVQKPDIVKTYKGRINGDPATEVRLTIDGSRIEGFFEENGEKYYIEPARKYSDAAAIGDSIVYKAEDAVASETIYLDGDIATKIETAADTYLTGQQTAEVTASLRELEIATEADYDYVTVFGGASQANSEILSILNMVEGAYSAELELSIKVVYQHTWTIADPFSAADTSGLLTAYLNYWNVNFPVSSIPRDVAHMFTGKSYARSRGIAYVGVICRSQNFSYGLSGYINWAPGKFLIPAHEIGHNLNADHVDGSQGSGCASSVMNASVSGSTPLSFCPFSRSVISTYVSANGGCLTPEATAPATGTRFDFNGDNRADIAVWRPSNGSWYVRPESGGAQEIPFGLPSDKPVSDDYDGDGKTDPAVFRAGIWWRLMSASGTFDTVAWGLVGDIPVPADFSGDGKADAAVFRPSNSTWYILASGTSQITVRAFGLSGDIPITDDYDGDGRADINVFRPGNGTWYRISSSNGSFSARQFGLSGDKPISGDFDGDGKADIAVWRPSNSNWYIILSQNGWFSTFAFGLPGDIPAPADYDGDGKADAAVYRPSNGHWYRLSNGAFEVFQFGFSADVPVPAYYIQ